MSLSNEKITELGLRIAAGDPKAVECFEKVVVTVDSRVRAFLKARTSYDVDDLAQEVWLTAWNKRAQFKGGTYIQWILQIARTRMIDRHRKEQSRRDQTQLDEQYSADSLTPEQRIIDEETNEILKRCIKACLSDQQANAFRMKQSGLTSEEMATQLGVGVDRVYRIVHDAIKKLKACVSKGDSP